MSAGGSGRYTRKNSGMLGAMLVTIGLIVAFVAFRALTREELVTERETVEYLPVVAALQSEGKEIAYPATLPDGRRAVDASITEETTWKLDTLRGNTDFVGVYQCRVPMGPCAEATMRGETERGEDVRLDSPLGSTWQTWSSAEGDRGVALEFGEGVVFVFGSAGSDEINAVAESLVTTKLP